jgi:uncharacterized membrane protein
MEHSVVGGKPVVYRRPLHSGAVIVAEPNRSASWQANKLVLCVMSAISLTIALGFAAIGAWPILPFAGIELMGLAGGLYYVSWKLRYRHVITCEEGTLKVQKGHYHPRQQWQFLRENAALSVIPEQHPWDGPQLSLYSQGEQVSIGEFLNRDDSLKLLELLRDENIRIGNRSRNTHTEF